MSLKSYPTAKRKIFKEEKLSKIEQILRLKIAINFLSSP